MGRDRAELFEEFLATRLEAWRETGLSGNDTSGTGGWRGDIPLVVSGMATSTIGWKELPYARAPLSLTGAGWKVEVLPWDRPGGISQITLISGVATENEIMRGEETQAAGLLADPDWSAWADHALLVLPGTHSKHIQIEAGQIVDFSTYMTGELFEVLARHSVLRASVSPGAESSAGEEASRQDFLAGVRTAKALGLAQALFRTRTRAVLGSVPPGQNAEFLSGVLIGAELVSADAKGLPVLMAAGAVLAGRYRMAMEELMAGGRRWACVPPGTVERVAAAGHRLILERRAEDQGGSGCAPPDAARSK